MKLALWSLLLLLSVADGEEKTAQKREISLLGLDSGFDFDGHGLYGSGDFGSFSNSLLPSTVHVPHPYPVDRPVPVPHPYPVFINKPVPYPVHIPIETPVPYPVPYPTGIHGGGFASFADGGGKHHAAPLTHGGGGGGGGKGHKHFGHHLAHLASHFSHHFKHKFNL